MFNNIFLGHQLSKMRNSIESKPYYLFQAIMNESDEKIIRLIKNNSEVASLAFSFGKSHQI
jgi:succinate dehydrogenase flavin-adding protein (antitoxin of CptAB toxin-antitoxin module)